VHSAGSATISFAGHLQFPETSFRKLLIKFCFTTSCFAVLVIFCAMFFRQGNRARKFETRRLRRGCQADAVWEKGRSIRKVRFERSLLKFSCCFLSSPSIGLHLKKYARSEGSKRSLTFIWKSLKKLQGSTALQEWNRLEW